MILCKIFEGMHDFCLYKGVKIMHTLNFVARHF